MSIERKVYQELASIIDARANCAKNGNDEWFQKHSERINLIADNDLPDGSGFDNGCSIDLDASNSNRIVIHAPYHHMDENGCYDGWDDYKIVVTPSLAFEFDLKVSGGRKDDRDYIGDEMYESLSTICKP